MCISYKLVQLRLEFVTSSLIEGTALWKYYGGQSVICKLTFFVRLHHLEFVPCSLVILLVCYCFYSWNFSRMGCIFFLSV